MANNPFLSDTGANAAANAVTPLLNSGKLRIYTSPQPANANTAVTTQTLLAELTFGSPAFGAASGGAAAANAITSATAVATGTAAWFRTVESDGATVVFDGSVGTSGCDLNLNSVAISSGASVAVTALSYTQTE